MKEASFVMLPAIVTRMIVAYGGKRNPAALRGEPHFIVLFFIQQDLTLLLLSSWRGSGIAYL
jgi:hypothetical protein